MDPVKVDQPEFGKRLRARRMAGGLSQKDIAGGVVAPSYISLLENGERVPTLDVVVHLAAALDTTPGDLLGDESWDSLTPAKQGGHNRIVDRFEARRLVAMGDFARAKKMLEERRSALGKSGDREQYLELGIELSGVLAALAMQAERLELLDELTALPEVRAAVEIQVSLAIDRVATLRELGRLWDARVAGYGTMTVLEQSDIRGGADHVRLLGVLVSILCELGEFDTARPLLTEMLAIADGLGPDAAPGVLGRGHWAAGMAYARMGEFDLARDHLARARATLSYAAMPTSDWLRFCRSTVSILLDAGDLAQAAEWLEVTELTARLTGSVVEQTAAARERARYELASGNPAAAAELFGAVTSGKNALTGLDLVTAQVGYSDALAQLGRYDEAVDLLRRTAVQSERLGSFRHAAEAWRRIDQLRESADRPRS
ncbi:helix-turn-helix transcriptional regulator [Kibdelosporangium persicum]|uniref:XRE family transcriptional regulator n=1 Tax=Kibdelosporangium persicum TaxID=2698649 RepID=A0ABX2FIY4_9PSEU|nr:XRE family transcriptional regulator [Kibdelosporangium persicum]